MQSSTPIGVLCLEHFWVIMSTGMGCIPKYIISNISNSTEIGTASPKITQQNLNFPLSNLRSPLSAHILEFPHRLAANTKRRQPSYIGHFFCYLYAHGDLLIDEKKPNRQGIRSCRSSIPPTQSQKWARSTPRWNSATKSGPCPRRGN
jgi:hypothetical protein